MRISKNNQMRLVVLLIFLSAFILTALELPEFGSDLGEVSSHYLANTVSDTGALSTVGAVVWSYRGYDTLGEITILLTAVTGILILLKEEV